ncbi:MAG: hypothetical protein KAR24_01010 [Candidatus Pacebacteria bacterium]|nr:hypothetical protein [Candidatus Paceibacterota bacterium]
MEQIPLQLYTVLYLTLAMASAVVGMLVFSRDKKRPSNIFFLALAVSIGLWFASVAVRMGDIFVPPDSFNVVLPYIFIVLTSLFFLLFALTFTQKRMCISNAATVLIFSPYALITLILYFFPLYIVKISNNGCEKGPLYWVFVVYVIGYVVAGLFLLFKRYQASAGVFKSILRSIIWIVGGGLFTLFITTIIYILSNNELFRLLGYLSVCAVLIGVGFKIMQYHRWRIKPFLTELSVLFMSLSLIVQMFFGNTSEVLLNTAILFFFIISGYFLVKSISREARVQDEIEKLVKDLTDVNEQLQILDKRKSEFVKISAYHLKDPLIAIKGHASMVLEESSEKDINKNTREATQKIFKASERLMSIIGDFVNISNIEGGKMEYIFEEIDVKELTESVLEEMKTMIERSGLDVSFDTDESTGYEVVADSEKLRQVVLNLTDNAIKYTPQGSVSLFLKRDTENKKLLLTITDTGIGMSKETINTLFEKFSRAHDANKVNTEGSGLGLYVAKEIMKKHNARIWVESPGEGKGSTFYLEFSLK